SSLRPDFSSCSLARLRLWPRTVLMARARHAIIRVLPPCLSATTAHRRTTRRTSAAVTATAREAKARAGAGQAAAATRVAAAARRAGAGAPARVPELGRALEPARVPELGRAPEPARAPEPVPAQGQAPGRTTAAKATAVPAPRARPGRVE